MTNVLWSIQTLRDQDNHDSTLMSLPTDPSSKGVKIPRLEVSLSRWTTHRGRKISLLNTILS